MRGADGAGIEAGGGHDAHLGRGCIYKSIQQVSAVLKVDQGSADVGGPIAALRARG
jgi:hypothetical protein